MWFIKFILFFLLRTLVSVLTLTFELIVGFIILGLSYIAIPLMSLVVIVLVSRFLPNALSFEIIRYLLWGLIVISLIYFIWVVGSKDNKVKNHYFGLVEELIDFVSTPSSKFRDFIHEKFKTNDQMRSRLTELASNSRLKAFKTIFGGFWFIRGLFRITSQKIKLLLTTIIEKGKTKS